MVATTSVRFHEVDVLRGLAAFTVVLSHYFPYWDRYLHGLPVVVPNSAGYYAVKLFFVISGFVIFMTLERCSTILDFVLLRVSRLYPAYWASLTIVTLISVLAFGEAFWLTGFVANGTMLQQFLGYPHYDNVYWSLSVELAFYVNAGWLFVLGWHRRIHAIVLVWLLSTLVWILTTQEPGAVTAHTVVATDARGWLSLLFAFDYAPYFAMGMLFYRVKRHGWSRVTAALLALAVGVEAMLASWEGIVLALSIGGVFFLAVNDRLRFSVSPLTLWLGAISYSLYLVHRNLGYELLAWLNERSVPALPAITISIAGALALATALTFGIEKPALIALRRRLGRLRSREGVARG